MWCKLHFHPYFHLLMLSVFPSLLKGQILKFQDEIPEAIKDPETVMKDWDKLEIIVKDMVNQGIKMLLPVIMDNIHAMNISSSCVKESMQVFGGIRKLKPWAVRFVDSSAKIIDGLLTGTAVSYGAYDECIETVAVNKRAGKNKGQVMFTGKYCVLRGKPSLPPRKPSYISEDVMDELQGMYKRGTILSKAAKYAHFLYDFPIRQGICIPSGCSVSDMNQVLAKVTNYTGMHLKIKRCEVKEDLKYTPVMIFVMSVYSFAGFMVLLGTLTDIYYCYSEKEPNHIPIRILLAFSLMSNFRKLVDTSTSSKSLSCLNGIRFITMSWIILCHSYIMVIHQLISGLEYVKQMVQEFPIQVIMNGFLAVDTFFFLGGFLVCYCATKSVKLEKRAFNIKVYILHRLWRILPVYIFVVLYVFIAEITISGPVAYDSLQPYVEGCEENWWTNFLFINNYYRVTNMCLPFTYYISLDMQFYIAALFILLPLFRYPTAGITIALTTIVISMITSAVVTYMNNFPPTLILSNPNIEQISAITTEFYYKPYPHCGPYVIGIITGYFLAIKQNLRIPKVVQLFGWCCSIVFGMSVIYGTYEWNRGREPVFWETIFYSGCHRVAWTLGVAWMVICCATGHGGIVNHILSWNLWIPLGRLTYISYLVHPLVQISFLTSFRNPVHPKHSIGVWIFFGHLVTTYGVAFAGSMLIESPFLSLEKLIFPWYKKEASNKNEEDSNHISNDMNVIKGNDRILKLNSNIIKENNGSENGSENPGFFDKPQCYVTKM